MKLFLEGKPKLYRKQYQNVVFEANKKSFWEECLERKHQEIPKLYLGTKIPKSVEA